MSFPCVPLCPPHPQVMVSFGSPGAGMSWWCVQAAGWALVAAVYFVGFTLRL